MNENGLVVCVVSYAFEEDAATEQRNLERLDIDVGMIVAPGVPAYAIGDERRKQTIKVAQEEDCTAIVRGYDWSYVAVCTHRTPHTSSSTRRTQLKPELGFSGWAMSSLFAIRAGCGLLDWIVAHDAWRSSVWSVFPASKPSLGQFGRVGTERVEVEKS